MSLVDRTNEVIDLSIESERKAIATQLRVDIDHDSSFIPSVWVFLGLEEPGGEDFWPIRLALHEAEALHDRLGLILGRSGTEVAL